MKKSIPTQMTQATIAKVVAYLSQTPERLESLSQPLSVAQLCQPPGPGKRSFAEILAHLLHCEARSSEAIYVALLLDKPLFLDIHPERQWGNLLRYDLLPFADLLVYFRLRRTVLLRVLVSLTESQWSRTINEEGKKRQESVYWRARSLALHEHEHLAEIEDKMEIFGEPSLEFIQVDFD